jgi:uncharacterized protein YueI
MGNKLTEAQIKDQCTALEVEIAALEKRNEQLEADLYKLRLNITEKRYINAAPDAELPVRILKAHLDYTEFSDNLGGLDPENPLVIEMNKAQQERNVILKGAIEKLGGIVGALGEY